MTSQQTAGLHPFVYPVKLVDPAYYPEIVLSDITSQEPCYPILADDYNIYNTHVIDNSLYLVKYQRQDYHELYFSKQNVIDQNGEEMVFNIGYINIPMNTVSPLLVINLSNDVASQNFFYFFRPGNFLPGRWDPTQLAEEISNNFTALAFHLVEGHPFKGSSLEIKWNNQTGFTFDFSLEAEGEVTMTFLNESIAEQCFGFHNTIVKSESGSLKADDKPLIVVSANAKLSKACKDLLMIFDDHKGFNVHSYSFVTVNDLSANWKVTVSGTNGPLETSDRALSGILTSSGYIYPYKCVNNDLIIHQIERDTGEINSLTTIKLQQNNINSCQVVLNTSGSVIYIAVRNPALSLSVSTLSSDAVTSTVQGVNPQDNTALPVVLAYADMCTLMYGFNNDSNNILQIANLVDLPPPTIGVQNPYLYNINKLILFGEVLNTAQTNMEVTYCTNPNNSNFVYLTYVTGTDQLRTIKMYRHIQGDRTYERYIPLVMWATRLGAIPYDYIRGGLSSVVDSKGQVYVFVRSQETNIVKCFQIKEFALDLGHTEGTVVEDVDTVSNMLKQITDNYNLVTGEDGILIGSWPNVGDVIISDVTAGETTTRLKLQYLNYDALQLYPELVSELSSLITKTMITLYENSSIEVLNLDEKANIDGEHTYVLVDIPNGTVNRPCVLKGTLVIARHTDEKDYSLIPVEMLEEGMLVMDHEGRAIAINAIAKSVIFAQRHNAPYFVPVNFFGKNRPFKPLLISGDHGILLTNRKGTHLQNKHSLTIVYAQDIPPLKQKFVNHQVEYYHLLLENNQSFFLANGLEIEGLNQGIVLRGT
jgi:hypothetical protein